MPPGERICVFCGSRATADAVLNALLFVPLGWVLGRKKGVARAAGIAAALSVAVELGQLFLAGRFTSLADVLANTLGAGLGAWGATKRRGPLEFAALLSFVGLMAPAFLLAPAPPEGIYYGQWTAVFGHMEPYRGRILEAHVGEIAVPSWKTPHTEQIREAVRSGAPVRLRVEAGPPPPGPAPVFSIFDHRQRGIFMLGADGDDVFVRLWRHGTTLRFSTPTRWWKDALSGVIPGDSVRIVYELGSRGPCLTIQGRKRCLTAERSVGSWSLLAPGGQGGLLYGAGSLIWAFLLGIPLGLLTMPRPVKGMLILGTVGAVAGVSWTLPYWPTPWMGILFLLLGTSTALTSRSPRT
ncbi:MAG: VanZ family protein [Gemmatimonadota bacterium]